MLEFEHISKHKEQCQQDENYRAENDVLDELNRQCLGVSSTASAVHLKVHTRGHSLALGVLKDLPCVRR